MACGCKNKQTQNTTASVAKTSAKTGEARPQKVVNSRVVKRDIR